MKDEWNVGNETTPFSDFEPERLPQQNTWQLRKKLWGEIPGQNHSKDFLSLKEPIEELLKNVCMSSM